MNRLWTAAETRYLEEHRGQTHAQIATALGRSVRSVRSRVAYLRRRDGLMEERRQRRQAQAGLVSARELSKLLGVSMEWVWRRARTGEFTAAHTRYRTLFAPDEAARIIAERTAQVESAQRTAEVNARAGRRLQAARVQSELSRQALARGAGVTPGALASYEAGRRSITPDVVSALARALGVQDAELRQWLFAESPAPLVLEAPRPRELLQVRPIPAPRGGAMLDIFGEEFARVAQQTLGRSNGRRARFQPPVSGQ